MARNTLAGTKKGKSKSARYYHAHPDSAKKKGDYDKKLHQKPAMRAYRSLLNKINRKFKKKGKGKKKDGKDVSHKKNGKFILEKQGANRARANVNKK